MKETQEDLKRHQSDSELNARLAKVLTPDGLFEARKWKDIAVGDVVRLESDDFIPADLVLLASSEPEGLCYIETSNLDGYVDPLSFRRHEVRIIVRTAKRTSRLNKPTLLPPISHLRA